MVARMRNKEMGVVSVAAAATMQTMEAYPCKTMELKWISRPRIRNFKDSLEMFSKSPLSLALIPIYISTKPYNVNPDELVQLYGACKHSCFRFPNHLESESESESDNSAIDAVDVHKLRIALSHSSILVSVFCKPNDVVGDASSSVGLLGDLIQRVRTPVSSQNSQLVGFGRAISDEGLTASIHDVMVIPSLRGLGIGRLIVQRIIRTLISRDIYDIAALCSKEERLFFEACGFGDDILGSTTMMYTRTVSNDSEGNQMVKRFGRKQLLVPQLKQTSAFAKRIK